MILDLIAKHESGGMYNRVYGAGFKTQPLTSWTINEVLAWQSKQKLTASGKYQIIRATLLGLVKEMKLSGRELFDENMQDRMALHLLNRRGFQKFLDGKISIDRMALNLSKEWASFPRDESNKSYYAGDGLNRALVSYSEVLHALDWEYLNNVPIPKKKPRRFTPFSFVRRFLFRRNDNV